MTKAGIRRTDVIRDRPIIQFKVISSKQSTIADKSSSAAPIFICYFDRSVPHAMKLSVERNKIARCLWVLKLG
jgi:hypothetical protein